MTRKAKQDKIRRINKYCNACVNSIESEFFEMGCTSCCKPHVVSIEFLFDCLTSGDYVQLNKTYISKRCPNYREIIAIIEEK